MNSIIELYGFNLTENFFQPESEEEIKEIKKPKSHSTTKEIKKSHSTTIGRNYVLVGQTPPAIRM